MQALNFAYTDDMNLGRILSPFAQEKNILIQIFFAIKGNAAESKNEANKLLDSCKKILPTAHIMLSSCAASIADGNAYERQISVSVSVFQKTQIKVLGFRGNENDIARQIVKNLVNDNTKLLIIFANTLLLHSVALLNSIYELAPHVVIAGGGASARNISDDVFVATNDGLNQNYPVVCAGIGFR